MISVHGCCRGLARLTCSVMASFSHLVFAYDDHLFSVPVSCAECGRRQRSQLRLARTACIQGCKNRMGGAEHAGVGHGSGSGRGSVWQRQRQQCWRRWQQSPTGQIGVTMTTRSLIPRHPASHRRLLPLAGPPMHDIIWQMVNDGDGGLNGNACGRACTTCTLQTVAHGGCREISSMPCHALTATRAPSSRS